MILTYISCSSDFDTIYVDVPDLLNYKAYNYQTLHSASPRCTDSAGTLTWRPWPIFCAPVTLTHFALTFDISTIRPTTAIIPCITHLPDLLTWQVHWPGCLYLYFMLQWLTQFTLTSQIFSTIRPTTTRPCIMLLLDVLTQRVHWPWPIICAAVTTFCLDVQYLLNYKAYNSHHTLHNTSPWPPDLAGTLTWWPWPIFHVPVILTQFTLTSQIFSTIRPTTTKPCIMLLLDVLTQQVHWPGDLDLYFALQWLWHILPWRSISQL